jgi:hypothetical protein
MKKGYWCKKRELVLTAHLQTDTSLIDLIDEMF